jgi:formate dehydrogenase major subunit
MSSSVCRRLESMVAIAYLLDRSTIYLYRFPLRLNSFSSARRLSHVPLGKLIAQWPVVRQIREGDPLGLGKAAQSKNSQTLAPRIDDADHVARSICPFCAVGCAQLVYVKDGSVIQIEGDPASPISRGRLCPKGAASKNMHEGPLREYKVKYRPPYGRAWQELSLDEAMQMIVDRILTTREESWEDSTPEGNPARRTMSIGNLGGATLDNEENYLIKKLMTALGVVQVENQARI